MKLNRFGLSLLGCVALLTGCTEHKPVAAAPTQVELPTEAQPPLPTMKLYVGPKEITAEIARTRIQVMTGMMFRTNVVDGDAMFFVLPQPQRASFWMKNCPEPLSCAYINPQGYIEEIRAMEAYNTNSIVAGTNNILFVLETHAGWFERNNIRAGMLVESEKGPLLDTFFRRSER